MQSGDCCLYVVTVRGDVRFCGRVTVVCLLNRGYVVLQTTRVNIFNLLLITPSYNIHVLKFTMSNTISAKAKCLMRILSLCTSSKIGAKINFVC